MIKILRRIREKIKENAEGRKLLSKARDYILMRAFITERVTEEINADPKYMTEKEKAIYKGVRERMAEFEAEEE